MFIHLVLADKKKTFFFTWKQFRSTVARKIFTNALGCLCVICGTCKLILIGSMIQLFTTSDRHPNA